MFFPGGARPAPHLRNPFALGRATDWPYNPLETPAFPRPSGDRCESEPQLLLFRRPAGRRDPDLPPCGGQKGKAPDVAALLSPGGRREGRRIRAVQRIVRPLLRIQPPLPRSVKK